jgi:phage-related protein
LPEYRFRIYEKRNGDRPVDEFIDKLRRSNQIVYPFLIAGLKQLRDSQRHRGDLAKPLREKLLEVRVKDARILFFTRPNWLIVFTHGFLKKSQRTPEAEIERAKTYRDDYLERCTNGEDQVNEDF